VVVGAATDSDWRIAGPGIAGHYARLAFDGATLWVTGLDAQGPVRIDGAPLVDEWVELRVGSTLALGEVALRVEAAAARFGPKDDETTFTREMSMPGFAARVDAGATELQLRPPGAGAPSSNVVDDAAPTRTEAHAPWDVSEDETLIQPESPGRASPFEPHGAPTPRLGEGAWTAASAPSEGATEAAREGGPEDAPAETALVVNPSSEGVLPDAPGDVLVPPTSPQPPSVEPPIGGSWHAHRGRFLLLGGALGMLLCVVAVWLAARGTTADEAAGARGYPPAQGSAPPVVRPTSPGAPFLLPPVAQPGLQGLPALPTVAVVASADGGATRSALAQAVAYVAEHRFAEAALAYEALAQAAPGHLEFALVARVMRARTGGAPR